MLTVRCGGQTTYVDGTLFEHGRAQGNKTTVIISDLINSISGTVGDFIYSIAIRTTSGVQYGPVGNPDVGDPFTLVGPVYGLYGSELYNGTSLYSLAAIGIWTDESSVLQPATPFQTAAVYSSSPVGSATRWDDTGNYQGAHANSLSAYIKALCSCSLRQNVGSHDQYLAIAMLRKFTPFHNKTARDTVSGLHESFFYFRSIQYLFGVLSDMPFEIGNFFIKLRNYVITANLGGWAGITSVTFYVSDNVLSDYGPPVICGIQARARHSLTFLLPLS